MLLLMNLILNLELVCIPNLETELKELNSNPLINLIYKNKYVDDFDFNLNKLDRKNIFHLSDTERLASTTD